MVCMINKQISLSSILLSSEKTSGLAKLGMAYLRSLGSLSKFEYFFFSFFLFASWIHEKSQVCCRDGVLHSKHSWSIND